VGRRQPPAERERGKGLCDDPHGSRSGSSRMSGAFIKMETVHAPGYREARLVALYYLGIDGIAMTPNVLLG
jgi:hypothetical protein